MLGTVEKISYDGEFVRLVELRLPMRGDPSGQLLPIRTCERIGQGSFGTVYRAVCDGYPRLALKIATGKNARLRQELEVLSKVCTKGKLLLPRFEFGAINKAGDLIVVGMELCVPCTLHDLLLMTRLTSEADMLFIAYQVLQAVASVHEQRCIHRDVKLQNFVFDLDGNLKLIDFGLASTVWNPPPGDVVAGTVSFMAPEMAHNALHRDKRVTVGAAADVWSAGIVLFSIFTQRNPYPPTVSSLTSPESEEDEEDAENCNSGGAARAISTTAPVNKTLKKENLRLLRRVSAGDWQWPVGSSVSHELRQLVEFILVRDPNKRPDILAILSKPIWNSRRRAPPAAVTAFLGVQDDLLLSHDEAHLLRAVEQRSADVTASLMGSRANSPEGEKNSEKEKKNNSNGSSSNSSGGGGTGVRINNSYNNINNTNNTNNNNSTTHSIDTEHRGSLKFVTKEETTVGGVPICQVYDVRPEARRRRPVREISAVIAEETAKGLRRGASKPRRDDAAMTSRGNSRVNSRNSSLDTSLATVHCNGLRENERYEDDKEESDAAAAAAAVAAVACGNVSVPLMMNGDNGKDKAPPIMESAMVQRKTVRTANGRRKRLDSVNNENIDTLAELTGKEIPLEKASDLSNVIPQRRRGGRKKTNSEDNLKEVYITPPKRLKKENINESVNERDDEAEIIACIAVENAVRRFTEEMILLEREYILGNFRVAIEEKQERYNMIWLEEEQRRSAAHAHRFRETTRVTKKYQYGFVCDMCDFEFLPDGKSLHFFHCTCGRDLCLECREKYNKQCTCIICGNVFENSVALRDHSLKGDCKRFSVSTVPGSTAGSKRSYVRKQQDTTVSKVNSPATSRRSVTQGSSPVRRVSTTLTETTNNNNNNNNNNKIKIEDLKNSSTNPLTAATVSASDQPVSSLFSRSINTLPEGQWKPLERLSVSYRPIQPTAEERELLLNGDWIRHFHLYPTDEEGEPLAFTYHIQPGRTGAIFLNHDFSMHSAVISVLERQMLIVDYVDTYESKDAARAVSLAHAKCNATNAYNLLQRVVGYDCNMIKQHRAPGTISVYRPSQTAVRCHGDPFVYVRWFRFDTERSLSAFLLSNGAVQVLVGDQYELRWFDENRKFLLRSNGVCEMIDDANFALAPDVSRLLYGDF
ncbi:Protein kinase domain [Trypanosoma melophagium]|uniref:Protein kinase domain n=1 Tax=Trypanosoma melophagium TaxID=715481 RepID=UPI00351A2292|nr:Protein kinase domain [Trypanosoma melophagium]